MEKLTLSVINQINGKVTLPGSKSLSNRILLLAALAEGKTTVQNLLNSDDVNHMLSALKSMGVRWELTTSGLEIEGVGGVFNGENVPELFLGNAGTAMRPLAAALCASRGVFTLTGEPRMYERPIGDQIDALRLLGAEVEYLGNEGYPPLKIHGKAMAGGKTQIRGNISSQFLTALLMSAPLFQGDLEIEVVGELVSKPYIEITLDVMKKFGVEVENRAYQSFRIKGGQTYRSPGEYFVEGDASSASYFLAAAAIKGGSVEVVGVGSASVQGDKRFAEVLEKMGAQVEWFENSIKVTRGQLKGVDVDLNHIPDAAMTIATTALFAEGPTAIRNIYNWRVKETDRLSAMATELRKVGAEVVEGEDFIEIIPPTEMKISEIATYNDHRMAMCFSLVALGQEVTILDPRCTSKTFPDYFERFAEVSQ